MPIRTKTALSSNRDDARIGADSAEGSSRDRFHLVSPPRTSPILRGWGEALNGSIRKRACGDLGAVETLHLFETSSYGEKPSRGVLQEVDRPTSPLLKTRP